MTEFLGVPLAGFLDFRQVLKVFARGRVRMRPLDFEIVEIVDFNSELGDPIRKSGHANRRWAEINSALALAKTERDAQDANR